MKVLNQKGMFQNRINITSHLEARRYHEKRHFHKIKLILEPCAFAPQCLQWPSMSFLQEQCVGIFKKMENQQVLMPDLNRLAFWHLSRGARSWVIFWTSSQRARPRGQPCFQDKEARPESWKDQLDKIWFPCDPPVYTFCGRKGKCDRWRSVLWAGRKPPVRAQVYNKHAPDASFPFYGCSYSVCMVASTRIPCCLFTTISGDEWTVLWSDSSKFCHLIPYFQ